MKKLLLIAAIGVFTACNEQATRNETAIDSTADAISDSLGNKGDSLSAVSDSTSGMKPDSIQKK